MSAIRRLLIGVLCLATTLEHAALAQGGPSGISQDVLCEVLAPKALPAGSYTQVARWASTDLKHIVGVPTDDAVAAGGRAWEGTASLAAAGGPLLFGPYAAMPAGDYVAFFRIQQTGELGEEAIGAIDACVNGAAGAAIARELGPGDLAQGRYVQVPLAFAMKAGSLECRLHWSATTSIRADTVTLFRRQGPQVPTGPAMVPQPVPTGAPSGLTYRPARPPFAGNFPRSSAPAAALVVCDVENRPTDVQFLAVSVQGLVNRTKPRVYCILNRKDRFWLEWMTKTGRVQSTKDVADAFALLARYRSEVKGVVVTDPALPATRNVATMAAGVLDGAIASPRLAARLGLPVLADLRGRWRKSADAYRWAYDSLWDRMSHRVAACIWPTDPGLRDYLIQHRLPVFWLPGRIDGAKPYADAAAEMHVMEQMLARMPANVPAMGLPWAGENVGMGEQPGVSLLAEFGKYVVASVGLSNASVHSGYPTPAFRQHRSAAPRLDPTKIYLSFLISDGDNLGCLEIGNWPDMWSGTSRGSIPAGWTISPSAAALLPDIVDYYYSVATPNDQFVAAVSGVGYTYPELYGKRYRQPSAVYRGFLDQTNRTMRGMDLVTVNPTGAGDRQIAGYAERVAGLKGIFADYGRTVGTYAEATVVTTGNVPVFHGVTSWVADGDREAQITHMVDQIREIAPSAGPGFLHAFACNWFYDLPALQEVMRRLGPRFVVVLPEHLAALCRQDMERRQVSVSIPETLCAIEGSTTRIPVSVRNLSSRPQSVRLSLSPGGGHGVVEPGRLTVKPAQEVEAAVTGVTSGKRVEVRASGAFGIRSCASTMLITPRSELCTGPSLPRTRFVSLFEAEGLPHIVGSEAAGPAASGGRVRAAVKGETQPGFLVHGPYRSFTAGWYVALFRLKRTGHGSGPTCVLDAIVAGGSRTLKVRTVSAGDLPVGKWRAVPVEFAHSGGPLETRVNWTGGASMIVDRVEVYRVK